MKCTRHCDSWEWPRNWCSEVREAVSVTARCNLRTVSCLQAGVCCQLLTRDAHRQAMGHFTFVFLLARVLLEVNHGRLNMSIYGWMFIDILIVMYRVYNLIFSVPITKASDNSPKSNKASDRAPCSTLVPPACIFKRKTRRQIWNTWCPKDQKR